MPTYKTKYNIDANPLGIGGAAKVYGCTRIADGERFAIKILSDKIDNDKVERLKREINVIVDIVSNGIDGVLPIYDYDKENLWYVMPLANSLRSITGNYSAPPSMMRVPTALIFHKLDFRLIPNQC